MSETQVDQQRAMAWFAAVDTDHSGRLSLSDEPSQPAANPQNQMGEDMMWRHALEHLIQEG
ncbi:MULTISPECIES: hypothetical protein [Actinomycetes]|uniref:hypothetical protein n=1 Tax=Actinomycetes TaxID=1760 RepID=UPI00073BA6DB|nr:hypothetical protein [Streptomyces sp. AVP053U2]ODA73190.1 hypothetical protein APS67_002451 [Streptomyces sp. AVP053U2]